MRILRAPQSRAFCNFKSLRHAERKAINKQTGEPLKICMHHMASPDPCMNNGNGCGLYKSQKGDQANERRTAEQ